MDERQWLERFGSPIHGHCHTHRPRRICDGVFCERAIHAAEGTIEAGKRADLVLLDANPLADIASVRRVQAVVLGGRLLRRTDLDALLEQARAAAR